MAYTRYQKRSGSAVINPKPTIERGIITHIYTNSLACDVITTGNKLLKGLALPNYIQFPNSLCAHVELPVVGTHVLVQTGTSKPSIVGYSNLVASAGTDIVEDDSPTNFRTKLPGNLLPGDWLQVGDRGQSIGVLGPGLLKLDSGHPWCKLSLSQEETFAELIARKFTLTTAAGRVNFDDTGDTQAVSFYFGTNSKTETMNENWRFWGNLDGAGFRFAITDLTGETAYSRNVDMSGNVSEIARGNVNISTGSKNEEINGTWNFRALGGTVTLQTLQLRANEGATVFANDITLQSSANLGILTNRDMIINSGRTVNFSVAGATPAVPGSAAVQWNVSNGSFNVDVGMPGPDLGTALSGINLSVYAPAGNVKLQSLLGKIILEAPLPDSVLLGTSGGVAISHAVKWELGLQSFLEALLIWLDTHSHPGDWSPPAMPASSSLRALLATIPSLRVKLGA